MVDLLDEAVAGHMQGVDAFGFPVKTRQLFSGYFQKEGADPGSVYAKRAYRSAGTLRREGVVHSGMVVGVGLIEAAAAVGSLVQASDAERREFLGILQKEAGDVARYLVERNEEPPNGKPVSRRSTEPKWGMERRVDQTQNMLLDVAKTRPFVVRPLPAVEFPTRAGEYSVVQVDIDDNPHLMLGDVNKMTCGVVLMDALRRAGVISYESGPDRMPKLEGERYEVYGMGRAWINTGRKGAAFFGKSLSYGLGINSYHLETLRAFAPEWELVENTG